MPLISPVAATAAMMRVHVSRHFCMYASTCVCSSGGACHCHCPGMHWHVPVLPACGAMQAYREQAALQLRGRRWLNQIRASPFVVHSETEKQHHSTVCALLGLKQPIAGAAFVAKALGLCPVPCVRGIPLANSISVACHSATVRTPNHNCQQVGQRPSTQRWDEHLLARECYFAAQQECYIAAQQD